jgi:Ser/Thr protein kinase RdoA (MazF antagonist)
MRRHGSTGIIGMAEHNPTARARALARLGQWREAEAVVAGLIAETFRLEVTQLAINRDRYSLNSLNGFIVTADNAEFFFKFHQEEGETDTVGEYYRAEVLREAGYPVDKPLHVSGEVGRQILLYRRRHDPRFADLCRALEFAGGTGIAPLVEAQRALDRLTGARYLATLHEAAPADIATEAVHRLFHARLVEPGDASRLGGRARRFYVDRQFRFPGVALAWRDLAERPWRINGITYRRSFLELLDESRERLHPAHLAGHGAVVAHGDAHNANVWVEQVGDAKRLVLFDQAFAGRHIPALLAEIKATFHNIFAHPFWLYDAPLAEQRYRVEVSVAGGIIDISHDCRLSPLRTAFLETKAALVWRPLLAALAARGWLPAEWRRIVRCALFCCPTLVMDLRAGGEADHNPTSSAIGLAVAITVGSEPVDGTDVVEAFLDSIAPA